MPPVALTIAGSDPSGGAGIQADLKTFHQWGVYGEAVVTLLTVQNTRGVTRVEPLAAELVLAQLQAVLDDIPPHAAKTGALGSAEIVSGLAQLVPSFTFPLVVDPVMISKHGHRLLSPAAEQVLKDKLLPHTFLLTPNVPEAEVLSNVAIETERDVEEAARRIGSLGCRAVLVKGGHLPGEPHDVLWQHGVIHVFEGSRVATASTHGAGCTYSAAITANLARGHDLEHSVTLAKAFIQRAIETAPGLGSGYGPLNHFAARTPHE
jgi:hydroxymethylpyrimidine/phosphomethylpyrimidine kinase